MIPQSCLLIKTNKFSVLAGEDDELVNERMYGKALCNYLKTELPKAGVNVPFFCNEDWGWWLEVERDGFKMGLCIYSDPDAARDPERYAIMPSIHKGKKWSWSKFRSLDLSTNVLGLVDSVARVFRNDKEVLDVTRHDEYPF